MKRAISCLGACAVLYALALPSCSLDDRPLNFEYHALAAAGSGSGSGGSSMDASGAPNMADAGAPAVGGASLGADGGDGGAAPSSAGGDPSGGVGGSVATGGASAGMSAASGAATGGTLSGGSAGVAGTPAVGGSASGSAGAPFNGPCGDLNHNLVDDCSETLVQNSRFDSAVNPWVAETSWCDPTAPSCPPIELTATWDATNASGKSGSGSLSLVHTGSGGTMLAARQCIPVTPNATYDFAARVQLAAGQIGTGGINVYFYDDTACQGNFVPPPPKSSTTPIEGGVAGSWVEPTPTTLWIPGNVQSVYVRLFVNKPLNQGTAALTVLIDDVLVAKRVMP